ncbi:MAG TPA: nucleosidase [Acidimicrobiales bacterium]|nr:nucleosidase [Acidimicrobiales bacterium]
MPEPLVVVAVRQEATYLHDVDHVLTGIGKVSAATAVAAAIADRRPSSVLNVGTAGALRDGLEGIHRVGRVLEHDVDKVLLGAMIGEELEEELVLDPAEPIVLATGDVFIQDPGVRLALAERAHLVDMEGYAIARACAAMGVPCEIVKVVSDTADEDAARSWSEQMDELARAIADVVADRFR